MGQSPQIGKIIYTRYKIAKQLDSGAFGDTYLAVDLGLPGHPKCVVKHLIPKDPNPTVLPIAKSLFYREAQILYQLGNDSNQIPRLFAYFEENDDFYLVQEFIDGHDLSYELTPGTSKNEKIVVKLLKDILEVLAFVHQHNVIHRDIKPQNIMRRKTDGKIVLIDFGAVKEINVLSITSTGQTSLTVAIGSPGYMPSEQAVGRPRLCSDIYAVGMIGIQALTGLIPQQLQTDPVTGEINWRHLVPVSDSFANVLQKMSRDHFSQRYQSAAEALSALNATMVSPPPPISPILPTRSISQPTQPVPTPRNIPSFTPISLSCFNFEVVTVNSQGAITKRSPSQAKYFTEDLGNGVTLEMIQIPAGSFTMGSPKTEKDSRDDERPQHQVTVPSFYLGKFTVTQAQWRVVAALPQANRELNPNPSNSTGDNLPVERISWYDAVEFCNRLSKVKKQNYRLPSEAEWEYACRAGTKTPFYFGETITPDLATYEGNYTYTSGSRGIYRRQTTPVGSFSPNAFGLYDMHGNVWEWCADLFYENYSAAPTDGSVWDNGNNSARMLRGGSWIYSPRFCRSAVRGRNDPDVRHDDIGFRVVVSGAKT